MVSHSLWCVNGLMLIELNVLSADIQYVAVCAGTFIGEFSGLLYSQCLGRKQGGKYASTKLNFNHHTSGV